VVDKGNATSASPGQYQITLTSSQTKQLDAGAYTLKAIAIGNKAYKPSLASTPVFVSSVPEFGSQVALLMAVSAISALILVMRLRNATDKR